MSKKSNPEFIGHEARYRACSEPHESPDVARKALDEFFQELSALRVKYRIRDLYVIYNVTLKESDGTETVASGVTGFGTQSLFESMAACAYGVEKQKHEEAIRRLLTGKTTVDTE